MQNKMNWEVIDRKTLFESISVTIWWKNEKDDEDFCDDNNQKTCL